MTDYMMFEDEVKEARRYYSEFKGEPPTIEEIVDDRHLAYVQRYVPMVLSFGWEIEQPDTRICHELRRVYEWHHDYSGPLETGLKPVLYPGRRVHQFIRTIKNLNCEWEWVGEYGLSVGCGSHLHFAIRWETPHVYNIDMYVAWAIAYNTLSEVSVLLLPMFAWGRERLGFVFRDRATYWAKIICKRYSPESARRVLNMYDFREYHHVTFNTKGGKRTIEIRLNETHPAISYAICIILHRITRRCIERGRSPKILSAGIRYSPAEEAEIHYETRNRLFLNLNYIINNIRGLAESARRYTGGTSETVSLYALNSCVLDIKFERGREIPGLKSEYRSYLELMDDIIKTYLPYYPPLARVGRLFLHRGYPYLNANAVWDVFAPFGE
ncbi:MAG TPA: hypothetical protein ENF41_02325, partial [Candidatus Bathyarchaeota archaeon]|nr:hypothetical protein [Candidatus Bathyarchaeota archaeon]